MPVRVTLRKTFGPKPKRLSYPSARAGGYRAPVDPSGMDEEMKKTLEIGGGRSSADREESELRRLRGRKPTRRPA